MQPQDTKLNENLVNRLLPAVKRMARSQSRRHPNADMEELVQVGTLGLLEAAERHRNDQTCAEGFALRRIRGAMLDFLRRQDPLTRRQRRAVRQLEAARRRVGQRLAHEPRASQVAVEAGVTFEEYAQIAADAAPVKRDLDADQVCADAPDALTLLQARELQGNVATALRTLDTRSKQLLVSYYLEDQPLSELGERFGVSSGRVSQLHKRAIFALRGALKPEAVN
jgi:RNA polymerase sigma factor for flagellar operon FliA